MTMKMKKNAPNISCLATLLLLTPLLLVCQPREEVVAVVDSIVYPLSILDYNIAVRIDPANFRADLRVVCAIGNNDKKPADSLDLDLFAREKEYGVSVRVDRVCRLADGGVRSLDFTRASLVKPENAGQEGTEKYPKITRIPLFPPIPSGGQVRIELDYTLSAPDPQKEDVPYRIFALLPDQSAGICFLEDFSWLPDLVENYEQERALSSRNFFPKKAKPSWRIQVTHPPDFETLVADGRLERMERDSKVCISEWVSVVGGEPQLLTGRMERVEIPGDGIKAVFLLPKRNFRRENVAAMGRFLVNAYQYYSLLFGPLEGKDIHIAASSADMGGHGAFLGFFIDAPAFQIKMEDFGLDPQRYFNETAAHELAHSWWGYSVSSYGRGTKFLREALSNFATWELARHMGIKDGFKENLCQMMYTGSAGQRLFGLDHDNQRLAYSKGALVLDLLRQEMGEADFFAVLKTFALRFKNGHATFVDFVSVCSEISRRDWLPFFHQWCYQEGYPIYKLVRFFSNPVKEGWKTTIGIRNEGQGIIRCPLELWMGSDSRRETFAVAFGEEKTLTFLTASKVESVVIDPGHDTFQGDESEILLKLTSLKASTWEWMNYWIGMAHARLGDMDKALKFTTLAVNSHEKYLGQGQANPAFYYSRGLIYYRMGRLSEANENIRCFFDRLLELGAK
jgi:hypothetical protein